jgi:hypothetical protein
MAINNCEGLYNNFTEMKNCKNADNSATPEGRI